MNNNLEELKERYNEPWRFHHTWNHVKYIIDKMTNACQLMDYPQHPSEEIIKYSAIFHDIVYDPRNNDNEKKSSEIWLEYAKNNNIENNIIDAVNNIILSTKYPDECTDSLQILFNRYDWMTMSMVHCIDAMYGKQLSEYENNIFKEYQFVSVDEYIKGRFHFINESVEKKLMTVEVGNYLKALLNKKYTIGYYVGSFNPFHVGHLNVLKKAEKMFDKVVVAQGVNPSKSLPTYQLNEVLKHYETDSYSNQLIDYINSKRTKYCNPVLVRGLRNGFDLNAESNLISFVNEQADARGIERIPVVYISCDKEFEHVSSSAIKMLTENDKKRYIPKTY